MKGKNLWLFLIGTFSMTQIQIIGSIGISELFLFVIAPFLFVQNYSLLKNDGFLAPVYLSVLSLVGCCIASLYNNIGLPLFLRGFASTYSIFAVLISYHYFLRNNFGGVKWLLFGICLTGIINTFIFQSSVESTLYAEGETGVEAAAMVMSSPLYWIQRLTPFIALPYRAWYLSTPVSYSILAPIGLSLFAILSTTSGRSAALGLIGASAVIFIGKKSIKKMQKISKHFTRYFILAIIGIWVANLGYRYAATTGILGEKALAKYMAQTQGSSSMLKLLMGGRLPFFVGLYAGCKQPIVGYGPWAIDKYGYTEKFLSKYGTVDDYEAFLNSGAYKYKKAMAIPAHSYIIGAWISNGVFGLIFWIYVLCKMFNYFRRNLAVVPQWYGILAAGMPAMLWDMFFSPYTARMYFPLYFALILFADAIAKGRIQMPPDMIREIIKSEDSRRH